MAGSLGILTLAVPVAVGPSAVWTASSFVDFTAALPSSTLTNGDVVSLWGSMTGTEANASLGQFIGRIEVTSNGGKILVTYGNKPDPAMWDSWPFLSTAREVGAGALNLNLAGNLGAGGGSGTFTANQGTPNAGGALSWPVVDRASGATGAAPPTFAMQVGFVSGGNLVSLTLGQAVAASCVPVVLPLAAANGGAVRITVDGAGFASTSLGLPVQLTDNTNPLGTTAHPLVVGGPGVAGTPAGGVLSVQGVSGGTTLPVTAQGALNTSIPSLADITLTNGVVTTPGSLVAGTTGILVTAHPNNNASSILRVSDGSVSSTQGQPFVPRGSYTFAVQNANQLRLTAEAGGGGTGVACLSSV